ncbi:MAG: HisA/HisF-related TIM barrel protein [Pirellulales bacterium]|nr:HisA/HisF-related TIM barrel protein [Pirellulales bacterium]
MKLIPVIDLKDGLVVHAVQGRRESYRPIQSCLASTSEAADIAGGLVKLGFRDAYVADLDTITGGASNDAVQAAIRAAGLRIWLDQGFCDEVPQQFLGDRLVVGTETLESMDALAMAVAELGSERVMLSLDHRGSEPLTKVPEWKGATISQIASDALAVGVSRFIDLDLARVGSSTGPRDGLADVLKQVHSHVWVAVGGGVRGASDLEQLSAAGYDAALVATALHRGAIGAEEIRPFV